MLKMNSLSLLKQEMEYKLKISESLLSAYAVVAYAADPVNYDRLVTFTDGAPAELLAGSLIDLTDRSLANGNTAAANLAIVLDYVPQGQNYIRVARDGLATFIRQNALIAASSTAIPSLVTKLESKGYIVKQEEFIATT